MPRFQWTAAAANWAVNVASVLIAGLSLEIEGANGITSGITVTGADCALVGNRIRFTSGVDLHAAVGVTVGAGADRCAITNNELSGAGDATTDCVLVSAAVDRFKFLNNIGRVTANTANGLLRFSAAATNIAVLDNVLQNATASSTAAAALGSAAVTGVFGRNLLAHAGVTTITSGTNGVSFSGSVAVNFFQNYVSDSAGSGILMPAGST